MKRHEAMLVKPKVKICCISSVAEAQLAIAAGAEALGLVGNMPSGPGIISDSLIAEIAASVPKEIWTFLLTSETSATKIIQHQQKVKSNTIQIVDELTEGSYAQIRAALPGIRLVQVIHVLDETSVQKALEIAAEVDMLLLDSGNPNLQVKVLGGTGRQHDWRLSRRIVEAAPVPVFLAGGIKATNLQQALSAVRPFGLDLCSSVRSEGKLDPGKLAEFFQQLKRPSQLSD
ncbi:MAG: phosphoribosylanthranilate isomerase [Candidatus Cloacimonadales bacterium]